MVEGWIRPYYARAFNYQSDKIYGVPHFHYSRIHVHSYRNVDVENSGHAVEYKSNLIS